MIKKIIKSIFVLPVIISFHVNRFYCHFLIYILSHNFGYQAFDKYQIFVGKLIETIVSEGDSFRFPPSAVHQEEAITDCLIIEASTPHCNDRVRVEKLFGMKENKGLKSTKLKDIIFK